MLSTYLDSSFSGALCKTFVFLQEERFSRWRSSKVNDFGGNRKRICDFLLVCNSNFCPILHRFGDLTAFMSPDPIPIPP